MSSKTPPDSGRIERAPLRDKVYDVILGQIVSGRFEPGGRLSDSAVAEELGVSRTPVREALLRLEGEGMLRSDHLRGFFVPPLELEDAEQLYPILWTLESLAVGLLGPVTGPWLEELRSLNRRFGEATDALRRQRLDRSFHERLCRAAGNERLDRILDGLRATLLRYELAFMAGGGDPRASAREHARLLDALEAGESERARELVTSHWKGGLQTLMAHLE
ncbi:MAG: GntR family transcriptional regulator [Gemmatimonadota bacterium]|jgi:DNA-binding GntR family transcriptional regulator